MRYRGNKISPDERQPQNNALADTVGWQMHKSNTIKYYVLLYVKLRCCWCSFNIFL